MVRAMTSTPSPDSFNPREPFTRAEALAAGITLSRLLGPEFQRLFRDCYISVEVAVTPDLLARAALGRCAAGSHASHHTAARLLGGCVPDDPDTHVSVPADAHRPRTRGIQPHLANPQAEVITHRGIPCSSPSQTVLDLAGRLGVVDLVVLGDSLVKVGAVTCAELVAAADRWTGHGAELARRAMRLVRPGVDSPMETRLRLLIVLAGLPEPVVDHHVLDDRGNIRYRLDLSYPQWLVAIEYEGRHHAESSRQWGHDIHRREALDGLGWRLLIARARDIYDDPGAMLARIASLLRERGVVGVGIRSDEWRRHFPGRTAA